MNNFGSWAQGSRWYEQLKVVDDMSYSGLWAQGDGCYQQLSIMDEMNDSISYELMPLDIMHM